jgi:hypothetical protein
MILLLIFPPRDQKQDQDHEQERKRGMMRADAAFA